MHTMGSHSAGAGLSLTNSGYVTVDMLMGTVRALVDHFNTKISQLKGENVGQIETSEHLIERI